MIVSFCSTSHADSDNRHVYTGLLHSHADQVIRMYDGSYRDVYHVIVSTGQQLLGLQRRVLFRSAQ